jgi:hypothetical protein
MMSHFAVNFVLAGSMLALGVLLSIFPRNREALTLNERLAPFLPFLVGFISLATGIGAVAGSRNDPGDIKAARLIATPRGPRVATLDEVDHFDPVAGFAHHGGGFHWKEQRLSVFDVSTKTRLFRKSLERTNFGIPIELVGDFGGTIGVRPKSHGPDRLRLLGVEEGNELGGPEVLTKAILAKNPDFRTLGSAASITSSECLEVRTADYRMTIDSHDLVPIRDRRCDAQAGSGSDRLVFDKHSVVSLKRIERELPPGAAPLTDTHESYLSFDTVATFGRGSSRVDSTRSFKYPRFATDSRTDQPLLFNDPPCGLLLHGDHGELLGMAVSRNQTLWQARLPGGLTELTSINGQIIAVGLSTVAAIDPQNGKILAQFDLN